MENLVSVVIPTYNRISLLVDAIKSVKKQDYENIEIIVIDDNSNDGTSDFLKKNHKDILLIRNNKNLGPAFAKNQGILQSKGSFILFLDSDSELINHKTITKMVQILNDNPKIGGVGGEAILDKNYHIVGVAGKKLSKTEPYVQTNNKCFCDYLDTSNLMTRKKLLIQLGGFDHYYFYPSEDLDLGIRLKKLGYKTFISTEIAANHKYSKTSRLNPNYTISKVQVRYAIKNKESISKIIIRDSRDWFKYLAHYVGLAEKIKKQTEEQKNINLLKKTTKEDIKKYLLTRHYYLLKALTWNIAHLNQTIKSRKKNFLDKKEIEEYLK